MGEFESTKYLKKDPSRNLIPPRGIDANQKPIDQISRNTMMSLPKILFSS